MCGLYVLATVDKAYWASLKPPLAPSEDDVCFYKKMMLPGDTLLLGCTRGLIPLSTKQRDLDPWYEGSSVIIGDWRDNKDSYANILGDGALNFTEEFSHQVLDMCSKHAKVFIARVFNYKLETMRIAAHFPKGEDFAITPTSITIFPDYSFFVWHF